MDAVVALGGIGTAFGLSSSAGLNAYIPLLIVALAARFPAGDPLLTLAKPYDVMTSWWVIGVLAVLLVIEILVDKIPAVDTVNDVIQTFIRPAAGAVLFAASADVVTDVSPVIALVAGILVAGSVHATKAAARPIVTATTAGTGNWLVSTAEDVGSATFSILAIVLPIVGLIVFGLALVLLISIARRWRARSNQVTG
jgi:hypothetical protein